MSNIVTHNTNLPGGSVQTYATSGDQVTLDLNRLFVTRPGSEVGPHERAVYDMSLIQALALSRILEAAIRDAQQGVYRPASAGVAA